MSRFVDGFSTASLKCALVASLLLAALSPVFAQGQPPVQCTATAAVPPLVRAEGITELVGDLVLNCTGGVPSAPGSTIPQVNIQVFLNVNITSRLLNDPFSEALLLIDDPAEANQRVCSPGPCPATGVGGAGINYAAPVPTTIANVYQGRQTGANSVTFLGVPIDPPGPGRTRVIRITNVRGNATQLGVTQTLVPRTVVMFVSVSGSTSLPLSNPQQTVAFVQPGMDFHVLSSDSFGLLSEVTGQVGVRLNPCTSFSQMVLRFEEKFPSAFAPRGTPAPGTNYDQDSSPAPAKQDTPGGISFNESGFYNPSFPSGFGLNRAGLADAGTRLMATFNNIPAGVTVSVEIYERGVYPSRARLVATDSTGAGPFVAASADRGSLTPVNGTATAVWEVLKSDPQALETFDFNVYVSYSALATVGTATVDGSFAPLSQVSAASSSAPIPRFASSITRSAFTTGRCNYNVLFPYVSNRTGFDSGIVISNTTADPFINSQLPGNCTIYYYGTNAPPPQVTQSVPAGEQLVWTLSGGGNFGIAATPGFEGYVIARCSFPYLHAYAFLGGGGTTSLSNAAGYLGIILDIPNLLPRTSIFSESGIH